MPVWAFTGGIVSLRSRWTRSVVSSAWGPVVGKTFMRARLLFPRTSGLVTDSTPDVDSRRLASVSRSLLSGGPFFPCATTRRGALKPGPNPSESRSYARQLLSDSGRLPASPKPSRSDSRGIASTMRTATLAISAGQG